MTVLCTICGMDTMQPCNLFVFFVVFFTFFFCILLRNFCNNCALNFIFFFHTQLQNKKKNPAKWALLHLLCRHHNKGPWLIGTYCIYPKSEQTVWTQSRMQSESRSLLNLSSSNFRYINRYLNDLVKFLRQVW